jgi:hypothetical protein
MMLVAVRARERRESLRTCVPRHNLIGGGRFERGVSMFRTVSRAAIASHHRTGLAPRNARGPPDPFGPSLGPGLDGVFQHTHHPNLFISTAYEKRGPARSFFLAPRSGHSSKAAKRTHPATTASECIALHHSQRRTQRHLHPNLHRPNNLRPGSPRNLRPSVAASSIPTPRSRNGKQRAPAYHRGALVLMQ